jgi:muramoyltetrapeptide carboxypeptidase
MVAADLARDLASADERSWLAPRAGDPEAEHPIEIAEGESPVEGVLVGGCLSLLTATLGTPFAPRLERALLVWEDVAEPSYRLDRMLTHLHLSGSLTRVRAMIAGRVRGRDEDPLTPPAALGWMRSWFDGPLGWGLPMGHEAPNRTFPLGLLAEFDPQAGRLTIDVAGAR